MDLIRWSTGETRNMSAVSWSPCSQEQYLTLHSFVAWQSHNWVFSSNLVKIYTRFEFLKIRTRKLSQCWLHVHLYVQVQHLDVLWVPINFRLSNVRCLHSWNTVWSYAKMSGFSPSQPQPDSASASPCAWISYLECFHVCFFCAVSLIKTIINYCYWQFGWILFHSRNIHINALAEAEPDISGILWFSLSQKKKCLYFLNETISSQISCINSLLWS